MKRKTRARSKILSLLVAIIMAIGLMPAGVRAMEAGSPDELSLHGPAGAGNYQHVYYGGSLWRILNNSGGELFLLSELGVASRQFDTTHSNNYSSSGLRNWLLNTFVTSNFSSSEQAAISSDSNGDKIFLLSTYEASNSTYFPGGNTDCKLPNSSPYSDWWLRSPSGSSGTEAFVNSDGDVSSGGDIVGNLHCVRPACFLNLQSVLFTSPAASGASPATGSTLTAVTPLTGNMKLTIADSSQMINIDSVTAASPASGSAITVIYSGATASTSNYLCVELVSGANTYRGVVTVLASASGTATFNLPVNITPGSYTLKLWNEKYNAANRTNYASTPVSKNISFSNPVIASTGSTLPTGIIGTAYTAAALTATGGNGSYTWSATGLPAGLAMDSTGAISGTATDTGTYSVTVTVTDANSKTGTATFTLPVYSMANIYPAITIVNGTAFSLIIYNTHGTLNGTNTTYGTLTGTASGNDTVISGALTGVPTTLTDLPLGKGTIKIRAVNPPATTLISPSFY